MDIIYFLYKYIILNNSMKIMYFIFTNKYKLAWVVELFKLNSSLRKKNMTQVGSEPTIPVKPSGNSNPSSALTVQPLRPRVKHQPKSIYLAQTVIISI